MTEPGPQIEGLTFLDHLGAGGYSDVYLYERRSPRMRVAVKVLKDGRLSAPERKQFAAEAETMAALADHPYIVQVFSADTTPDGRPYLVMKYYPPPNMGVRAANERLSVASVLRTGIHICSAVEAAHRAGILHRDIKPANLLVSQYGEPGLTDFGIAGFAADPDNGDDLGVSIPWSAPEVLSGASNGSISSDVYSLGATFWHLLVGRSPFELPNGDNSARSLMTRVLRSSPPVTGRADVPASLERLLQQTMSKSAAQRPKSALDLARALQIVEQEQRFARTEVMVEDLGRPGGVQRPTAPVGDRTRTRTPTRVEPAPTPASNRPSGNQAQPTAARPHAGKPGEPVGVSPTPTAAMRTRASSPQPATASTVLRPATATVEEAAEARQPRKLSPLHVSVIAGAAVIAAVILGVVISASGGKEDRLATNHPSVQDTEDTNLGSDQLTTPVITSHYDARTKVLRFAWAVPAAEKNVTFVWALRSDPQAITRTAARSLQVTTATPASICISVRSVPSSGGAGSLASSFVCGKA